jgi:hypothetical protein
MAVRSPLYWDGSALREMSSAQVSQLVDRAVYSYGANPSATVVVVSSGGNISPSMTDTRMTAGAYSTRVDRFPTESETAEPGTVTVTYDKISQSNASVSTPTDTNNKAYPAYWNGTDIQAMNATDVFDTFIDPAIDDLVDGSDRSGTFRIHTSTSLSGHVLANATPVFVDTRANTGAYTSGGIPETLDQPTTINNYYLFRGSQGTAPSYTAPLQIDGSNNLQQYSGTTLDSMLLAELRHHTVNTTGSRILYSVNGTGNNKGSGMVNTKLNGNGNYQQRFVNANDYRAQEFPSGTAVTISTWFLRIRRG